MKVFFMCTHPNQGTGYARVANKITNFLADLDDVELTYFAFQNYKGQDIKDRYINPKIKFKNLNKLRRIHLVGQIVPMGEEKVTFFPGIFDLHQDVEIYHNRKKITKMKSEPDI